MNGNERNASAFVAAPKEYDPLLPSKQHISEMVRAAMKEKQLSLRKAADLIPGMSFPQIARITGRENYNIHTLLKVLNILDLEIEIKKREPKLEEE